MDGDRHPVTHTGGRLTSEETPQGDWGFRVDRGGPETETGGRDDKRVRDSEGQGPVRDASESVGGSGTHRRDLRGEPEREVGRAERSDSD